MRVVLLLLTAFCCLAAEWRAGVAVEDITPAEAVWMSGYGGRSEPSQGVAQPLYAKALALEDAAGRRAVVVTTDLIGVSRALSEAVAERSRREYDFARERILLTASHTHAGPALAGNLPLMQPPTEELRRRTADYTRRLEDRLVALIDRALADLQPARLSFHVGRAGFAANRRELQPDGAYRLGYAPNGPVDHDVPALRVAAPDGGLLAALFSYAAHNTTLGGRQMELHGDYAGAAQEIFEREHPGTTALFMSGSAGDANPRPRGEMEHVEAHGRELAHAVAAAFDGPGREVAGPLRAAFRRVAIPLETPPPLEEWRRRAREEEGREQAFAAWIVGKIEREGELAASYEYPLQALQLGDAVTLVALGGEVVSGYGLQLEQAYGPESAWVVAYANDVMGYIPTAEILAEGGYEAEGSQMWYGLPAKWDPAIEPIILEAAGELIEQVRNER